MMTSAVSIPTTSALVRASYGLLTLGLVIGTVMSVLSPRASLLAWSAGLIVWLASST